GPGEEFLLPQGSIPFPGIISRSTRHAAAEQHGAPAKTVVGHGGENARTGTAGGHQGPARAIPFPCVRPVRQCATKAAIKHYARTTDIGRHGMPVPGTGSYLSKSNLIPVFAIATGGRTNRD